MQCISPVFVRNKNFNGPGIFVDCGKCNFCLVKKQKDWVFRIQQEERVSSSSLFITTTYDDNHLVYNVDSGLPELCVRDVQLFVKRLRKAQALVSDQRLRYYACGEYGTDYHRPHYHFIMFNMECSIVPKLIDLWRGGFVHVGDVNLKSIRYVTKYVINRHGDYSGREPPRAWMSRNPGIGANYLISHKDWQRGKNYGQIDGVKMRLPRYYKERMFEPWERSHMARVAIRSADEKARLELQRMSRLHPEAFNYINERAAYAHENIFNRLNEKNKF